MSGFGSPQGSVGARMSTGSEWDPDSRLVLARAGLWAPNPVPWCGRCQGPSHAGMGALEAYKAQVGFLLVLRWLLGSSRS